MGGLFNTLEIASSSLLASRAGIETAGVNISNVNNPGYARQRVIVEPRRDPTGAGAGVEVVGVKSLRDSILDDATEICVTGVYIESFETLLERTLNALPPPSDNTAEAPSIMDRSSRYKERSDCSPSCAAG